MFFTDQLNRTIELTNEPKRIISLVPSQSELLWDLGLRQELVGITKFCIHPDEMYRSVSRVGGTKQLNLDKIRDLQPDLIIGNKEENEREQIETLMQEFPVWMSDIYTYTDALDMIKRIGELTNKAHLSQLLIKETQQAFDQLSQQTLSPLKTLYLIWREPYMAAGRHTFINDMMQRSGFDNLISDADSRYINISIEQIKEWQPELVLLSSEPYPFTEKHVEELQAHLLNTKILLADGEMFSWYGSRMKYAPEYLMGLRGM